MERLRKGCGLGTPHGEHNWECEDWGRVRCPGRDSGDASGLNAIPCGNSGPHNGHLWSPSAQPWEVRRCFGALGADSWKLEETAPVDAVVSIYAESGEKISGPVPIGPDGSFSIDEIIGSHPGYNRTVWIAPGEVEIGRGRMSKSKRDYTRGEFLEEFGKKNARCQISDAHNGHAWFNDYPGPGGGKNQWWWCDGFQAAWGLPSKFCGRMEQHEAHNWEREDRHDFFCAGEPYGPEHIAKPDDQSWEPSQGDGTPEGTPGPEDVTVDLSPDFSSFPPRLRERLESAEERRLAEEGYHAVTSDEAISILRRKLKPGERRTIEDRQLPVRWADRAMFKAEPIRAEEGPKVYLLWMTPDPLGAIAAACKMYKGEVVRDLRNISDVERFEYLEQVRRTKLKAPYEFVQFHFMIEGVTRSFTHQMVRQRTAAYAQESLRFAVVAGEGQDMPVALPPSLSGLPEDSPARLEWDNAVGQIEGAYSSLVELYGIPAEDARGLLPHNVMTRLNYTTNLRALLDHAGNRLCTQAQFEWRLVFAKIIESIREMDCEEPADADGTTGAWMAQELTGLFQPVCYQTGKCEFKANFDRACSIRDRVDANAAINRPSSEWGKDLPGEVGDDTIPAIKPGEWLLDHTAARRPE